jgi:RNA polymerase sigma-70 factor (ECF subfamily)
VVVARHKLIDFWRRSDSERRRLRKVAGRAADDDLPFAAEDVDPEDVRRVLSELSPSHRAALTLKYVDACSLAETAEALGRSVKATGSLLVRARRAMRERLEEVRDE